MSKEEKAPQPCTATMESAVQPGHVHVCSGAHDAGDHLCALPCGRYFWQRPR